MRQFLVAAVRPGAVIAMDGPDHHYLVRVLRLRPGAVIAVADAAGHRARATVTEVAGGTVRLLVDADDAALAGAPAPRAAPGAVTLLQALPRGALMDRVVRQATELGAARIVPVVAERTQGRADPAAQARRRERWQRIARQAAQQSGSAPPVIEPPAPLRRCLERAPAGGLGLLFQPGAAPLRGGVAPGTPAAPGSPAARAGGAGRAARGAAPAAAPDRVRAAPRPAARAEPRPAAQATAPAGVQGGPPAAVWCAVGPEGGFSPAEQALFGDHGFHPVGLPGGVLRVDTAVVAALTATRQYLASLTGP